MTTFELIVLIVLVALAVLIVGGMIGRALQTRRTEGSFRRALSKVDRDLATAAAADRGWDREHLEAAARRLAIEELGTTPQELVLVEVLDRPGTDADEAVFTVRVDEDEHRLVLGRREGEWVHAKR